MALEGQDFLLLPLGDLQLTVDHLRLGLLVSHRAGGVGVVTEETRLARATITPAFTLTAIKCLVNGYSNQHDLLNRAVLEVSHETVH